MARVSRSGWALGTQVRLTVFHPDSAAAKKAIEAAFRSVDAVEEVLSLYRPQSQVSELNRTGRLDHPHPWLVEVLEEATHLSGRTKGAFDITVQPLWSVYDAANKAGRLPEPAVLKAALAKVGWERVVLEPGRVRLQGRGTQITLNGLAQGYAADVMAAELARRGVRHALVDSGEISGLGTRPGAEFWSIGIKHPRQEGACLGVTELNGRSLATSGDYQTRFGTGYRNHHLVDPRTGHSPEDWSSVSVAAPSAFQADALSTAAFLLDRRQAMQLVRDTPGADALFIDKDGRTFATEGFPFHASA